MFGDYDRLAITLQYPTLTEYEIEQMAGWARRSKASQPVRRPRPEPRRPDYGRRRTRPSQPPAGPVPGAPPAPGVN